MPFLTAAFYCVTESVQEVNLLLIPLRKQTGEDENADRAHVHLGPVKLANKKGKDPDTKP